MKPVVYYCYDAYCGWCYGFSRVIKKIAERYKDKLSFEVLSGGMIPAENPRPIAATADYINEAYHRVEELTGIKFGEDYLWHIRNPIESDWFPHSEKAAIALSIFKEIYPELQVQFAADLQYALHYEGRDLTDDEAYRHLLENYKIDAESFYTKLKSEEYKEKAHYEFSLCKQLQVTGFPAVLLQIGETKFYLVARGYATYEDIEARIENILKEVNAG
ncbi:MAG: DsbA family protein [Chitinophagaceae bacterium]|nr:DsbA family protein [Chitinophagaceae bacterium]MBP6476285.1 DsbA family protein [Chitinophagaceae bacterium]MBP7108082.1 DsbA family protein [Chitinophagaceae bacterium]MBP7313656.1 DsbA family protein [Chitinophagaceae bacterium]HQX97940.1 DsbA family protein [Chitinophagaceae bacterium]